MRMNNPDPKAYRQPWADTTKLPADPPLCDDCNDPEHCAARAQADRWCADTGAESDPTPALMRFARQAFIVGVLLLAAAALGLYIQGQS